MSVSIPVGRFCLKAVISLINVIDRGNNTNRRYLDFRKSGYEKYLRPVQPLEIDI